MTPSNSKAISRRELNIADGFVRSNGTDAGNDNSTIPVVLATNTRVDRGTYWEQLSMRAADVDLSRSNPLPLILSHDAGELPIGVVEGVRIEGGVLRGNARFASTPRAQEVAQLVREKVASSVSIGYAVGAARQVGDQNGQPIYEFPFTPYELSVVAVPADPASQFFRSHNMTDVIDDKTQTRAQRDTLKLARLAEQERTSEIIDAGEAMAKHGGREIATAVLKRGGDMDDFRTDLLARMSRSSGPITQHIDGAPGFIRSDSDREYSLSKLISAQNPQNRVDAGFELEHSQELERQYGKPGGNRIYVPTSSLVTRSTTKGTTGGNLIATELHSESFVDVLRPYARFIEWVTTMAGLQGDQAIPRKLTSASVGWIAGDDGDGLSSSDPTFDKITISPKTVGAYSNLSHKMLTQSGDAEQLVRADLAGSLAQEIARAIIAGLGSSNQPRGILNQSGIGAVTYTAGGPSYGTMIDLESSLATQNALVDEGRYGYVTTPAIVMQLKMMLEGWGAGNTDRPVWTKGANPMEGTVNTYSSLMSSHIPTGRIVFANWADVILAQWGGIMLDVNPYGSTDWTRGTVSVRIMADVDVALRTAKSVSAAALA